MTELTVSRDVDPFTFEIIRHKLFRVIDEGLITLGKVSGTTVTAEGHDVIVALYLPDGEVLLAGLGFLHHIVPASRAVKQILDAFGDDPGVNEGDVFFANDPFTVAMHAPDIFMITPIHHEGKLASWVVNYVHVTDIGGIDVGGFCPNARESYHEGFTTKGLKLVEGGKLRRDVYDTFLNMIRDPAMTGLDLKSQMAANHVVHERMQALYREYGFDTVNTVSQALIEESERRIRRRLRELPDGEWQARRYLDFPDRTYTLQLTARKEGDRLEYDFTGTDAAAEFPINSQYWATKGAALAPLFPLLAWDATWNEGIVRCLEVIAPEGTLLNAQRPSPISLNTISSVHAVNILSNAVLSKMLGASPAYQDRAVGCWMGSCLVVVTGAVNRFGEYVAQLGSEVFGMPEGARAFRDGAGSGGHIVNVAQKMGNVESEEQAFPKLYLYRRVVPDTGGAGKFRGGPAHEHAVTAHGTPTGVMTAVVSPGTGAYSPGSIGTFGGGAGSATEHRVFRNANIADRPTSLATTRGERTEDVRAAAVPVGVEDILYIRPDGGGGYGDPIDRDPELVLDDVRLGIVSLESARSTYGVVIGDPAEGLDAEATAGERRAIRERRLGAAPRVEVSGRHEIERTPFRINEYLQLSADRSHVQCTWCGEEVCEAGTNWKEAAVRSEAPYARTESPPEGEEYVLRSYFCPACGTSLDVEGSRRGDPPLLDTIRDWPG